MSLTFCLMLLAAIALSVVLLAALAIHLNPWKKTGGDEHGNRSSD